MTDSEDVADAAAQAPVVLAAWRFLVPFYEDKNLGRAWAHADPTLRLCWTQWWAEANETALQANGHDPKTVARALADVEERHRLWPDFERVIIRDIQPAYPLDPQRWGIGVAARVVAPDVELLYVHREVPAGGTWAPGATAEVAPVVMGLTEGLWRVLNLGSEVIPEPGCLRGSVKVNSTNRSNPSGGSACGDQVAMLSAMASPQSTSPWLSGVQVAGPRSVDGRSVGRDDGSVSSIPLAVLPDPEDEYGLQAWTDAIADEVPLRLLVDTGTPPSAVPQVEPFATRPRRLTRGGRGAFGAPAGEEMLVETAALRTGDLVARELLVQLQPEGWRHPGLLGMDVLGSHRCDFYFDVPRIDLDRVELRDAVWYPLTTAPHHTPKVQVEWDQTSLTAMWDTGAGATLVDQSWASQHPDIVAVHPETGRGIDVTCAETSHLGHDGSLPNR